MTIYLGMGLVLIQLETSVDTVNDRNNCLNEKNKKKQKCRSSLSAAERTVRTRTSSLCVARDWQAPHAIQSAHRQIGENEDPTKARGLMRHVHANLSNTSNTPKIPLKWAKLE